MLSVLHNKLVLYCCGKKKQINNKTTTTKTIGYNSLDRPISGSSGKFHSTRHCMEMFGKSNRPGIFHGVAWKTLRIYADFPKITEMLFPLFNHVIKHLGYLNTN